MAKNKNEERLLQRLVKDDLQKFQDSPVTEKQVKDAIKAERKRINRF